MNELRIYWEQSVLYSNVTNYFTVGYIATTGPITDITTSSSLGIIIIEPSTYSLTRNVNNSGIDSITVPPSDTNITLAIKLEYITATISISQVLSFTLVPQINLLNQNDIQLLISRVLPPNVYNVGVNSTVYPRLYGIANTLVSLYQKATIDEITTISTFIDDIFPINGNPNWEITLDGTQSLLYQSTQQQYGQILQHLYATTINNDNNPYYYAFNISKFIYLLIGQQYYVALNENKANIYNSFIIGNNNLGSIILSPTNNDLQLNINIFPSNADPNPPLYNNKWQQNIINQYIRRITRCAVSPIITYATTNLGLNLNDTYWGDPRQIGTYCIAYNQGVLEQAKGYVLPVINVSEVAGMYFQIYTSDTWFYISATIPISVRKGTIYRLRLLVQVVSLINPPYIPNPSQYGQFYIGNNGELSDITVSYNPNPTTQPTNDNYFTIVFNTLGIVTVNSYGLWFNIQGKFNVTL